MAATDAVSTAPPMLYKNKPPHGALRRGPPPRTGQSVGRGDDRRSDKAAFTHVRSTARSRDPLGLRNRIARNRGSNPKGANLEAGSSARMSSGARKVNSVTPDPLQSIPLEPDEVIVRRWAADAVELDGAEGPSGWFILSNRRCLFARREGWFGARTSLDASRSVRLEGIRFAGIRCLPMRVGLGQRGTVPGIELDGRGYRTGTDASPSGILVAIARERVTRREGLHLVHDAPRCGACATDNFPWTVHCLHCGRTLGTGGTSPVGPP